MSLQQKLAAEEIGCLVCNKTTKEAVRLMRFDFPTDGKMGRQTINAHTSCLKKAIDKKL